MTTENGDPPVDLSVIETTEEPVDQPNQQALEEERAFEFEKREIEVEGLKQDLIERKNYARRIFTLICFWLGGMVLLLLLQGFLSVWGIFTLSESVILAAIGGTTVNVLGIFIIVVNYLFPKR